MSSKVPGVSIVGGSKDRAGFQPLPSCEPPALVAARKSRKHKNRLIVKIGGIVLVVSAAVACLTAFLLTRGSKTLPVSLESLPRQSRVMEDTITAVGEVESVARGNTVFGGRLYNLLREEPGNIIMSPFSVSGVMAMVNAGAGGETATQVTNGMSFPGTKELAMGYKDAIPALRTNDNFTLEAANTIFGMEGFDILPGFRETMHQHFHASIQTTDFSKNKEASRLINDWVEKLTREKIKDLIKPDMLNSLTRLVLVNAIYFKGDWASKFDPKRTRDQDFQLSDGSKVAVPMMTQTRKYQWASMEGLDAAMIELPYKGDRIVMQILLPRQAGGLRELEDKLRTEELETLFQENKMEEKVALTLPRFKLEQTIPLNSHLESLGIRDMFVAGQADFSGIDGTRELFVSTVVQKAFIEVNEEGSEAAAATGAVMMMRSMPMPPEEFVADHPFLFYLRDRLTGMLLFQGRVQDPSK